MMSEVYLIILKGVSTPLSLDLSRAGLASNHICVGRWISLHRSSPLLGSMLPPRRTQGIEIHNAIADDEGTGDRPPRKKTTLQTQSACADNRRQVPDGDFFLAYG
jgi:hypothetical protein